MLSAESANAGRLARELRTRGFHYLLIAARGTSDNAARYAQYLFGAHNRLPVALATPSLYTLYQSPPDMRGALVAGISQSGRSPDILSVLAAAREQGCPTLAITNAPDSPLAQTAEWTLPLHAGEERAVAATKTYTASLAALALLSTVLGGDAAQARRAELERVPELMRLALAGLQPALSQIERYTYMQRSAVIGRGFNYATAFEIALKIKELTRIVTESYSSADFLHGPIAVVEQGFPLILVAPAGRTLPDLQSLAAEARRRGAEIIAISDHPEMLAQAHTPLPLPPGIPEWLSPLVAVLPGQLIALHLAQSLGYDVDHPAGLQKVTETR